MKRRVLYVATVAVTLAFLTLILWPKNAKSFDPPKVAVRVTTTQAITTTTAPTTTTTAAPKPPPTPVSPVPQITGDDYRFWVLDCIARHEGNPPYTNGLGIVKTYRGRYQFDQSSWDGVAAKYGRPDLVGVDVAAAAPADQDDMAWRYFQASGYSPWPPSQGKCP